jgi:hypothetical protein
MISIGVKKHRFPFQVRKGRVKQDTTERKVSFSSSGIRRVDIGTMTYLTRRAVFLLNKSLSFIYRF